MEGAPRAPRRALHRGRPRSPALALLPRSERHRSRSHHAGEHRGRAHRPAGAATRAALDRCRRARAGSRMNRREALAAGVRLIAAGTFTTGAGAAREKQAPIVRRIPSSGEEIPVIGLGTSGPFEVGESAAERAPLGEVLAAFFASGARLIDTSPMYSTAERVLGELMTADMHRRAFLATKVWTRGERAGVEQMTQSGQLLKSTPLDLIQVHNLLDLDTQLKTLRGWKDAGRVRYIGVTHYTVSAHADLARVVM